jgi:fructose-1,6-bisphosphatase/inositol monophosphatase family enzyme
VGIDRVRVAGIIARITEQEVMSRFGALRAAEIGHKAAGEIVTAADLRVEHRLTAELTALLPGSVVVGEEGVADDPGRLELLAGQRPVWVIDPLDGTARFARSDAHFATMVALVDRQQVIASWIDAPALGLAADAVLGEGIRYGGVFRRLPDPPAGGGRVLVTDPAFQSEADRVHVARLVEAGYRVQPCHSAGTAYLDLVAGRFDAAVFGWTKVWDHAPGLLLHAEAGGVSAALDGRPLRPAGGSEPPLVVAADVAALRRLRSVLLPG